MGHTQGIEAQKDRFMIEEQINSDAFLPFCDYFYTPRNDYDYAKIIAEKYPHIRLFSPQSPIGPSGIIFLGMGVLVEEMFPLLPGNGSYLVIIRDTERPFIQAYYDMMPRSVRHVFTIECQVDADNVTAMPFGTASIMGPNPILESVRCESIEKRKDKRVFCRMNTNPATVERNMAYATLRDNPLVTLIEHQIDQEEFYREIKAHEFCLSLAGGGKDTTRTWESIYLGVTPIISDCKELRYFEDMPLAYYPGDITNEWLDSIDVSGKSKERAKMSYWKSKILSA